MTYFFLANPNSGVGRGQKALNQLIPYMDDHQISYKIFKTTTEIRETQLLSELLEEMTNDDKLVVVGGDGTMSLVLNQLPADLPFSYIPAGSGNDFARSLNISREPIEAFQAILNAEKREFYVLRYSSSNLTGFALNNIGIGLDAAIVKATNGSRSKAFFNKIKMGQISYFMTALRVLFVKKPFQVAVKSDETFVKFDKAFLMTFTKHPFFGGGIQIAPTASNLTNLIDLVEIDRHLLAKIFSKIPKLLKAEHLSDKTFYHARSKAFEITSAVAQPVQIDGESFDLAANETLILSTEKRIIQN